jgi:hypothetical protein
MWNSLFDESATLLYMLIVKLDRPTDKAHPYLMYYCVLHTSKLCSKVRNFLIIYVCVCVRARASTQTSNLPCHITPTERGQK